MTRYIGSPGVHSRSTRTHRVGVACCAGVLAAALVGGCGAGSGTPGRTGPETSGLDRAERYVSSVEPPARAGRVESVGGAGGGAATATAFLVNGEPVPWSRILPALAEAAGAIAIEETALDMLLERECARAGVRITNEDVERERLLLAETMAGPSNDAARGQQALAQVRRERGLGETRFAGMLRRNAMLRRLVQDEVAITPMVIDQAYELRYGERIGARIITTATPEEAAAAAGRVRAGEPFGEVAARVSTDASASRGGIIEPVSPADQSYPASVRRALTEAAPGALTPIIAVERGYALLQRDTTTIPAVSDRPPIDAVRADLEREARMRQERLLMGRLARRLLDGVGVTALDGGLDQSWRWRRNDGAELLPPRR